MMDVGYKSGIVAIFCGFYQPLNNLGYLGGSPAIICEPFIWELCCGLIERQYGALFIHKTLGQATAREITVGVIAIRKQHIVVMIVVRIQFGAIIGLDFGHI